MTKGMVVYHSNEGEYSELWIHSTMWPKKGICFHSQKSRMFTFYSSHDQASPLLISRGRHPGDKRIRLRSLRNEESSHFTQWVTTQHKVQLWVKILLQAFEDMYLIGMFQPVISINCVISLDDFFQSLLEMTAVLLKSKRYYIEEKYKQQ